MSQWVQMVTMTQTGMALTAAWPSDMASGGSLDPPVLAWSSKVSDAAGALTGSGYSGATDPHMVLIHSPGPDQTMAPVDSLDHPDQPGPSSKTALRYQNGHRLWPRPQTSTWTLAATWARNINTDPGVVLRSILGQVVFMASTQHGP